MLQFIYRFQQQRQGILNMPKRLNILNEMLTSQSKMTEKFYSILPGDKRGRYLVVNNYHTDTFRYPLVTQCRILDSAISTIYRLICKNHPELLKVKFELIEQKVARFPKKHHKLVRELYYELCMIDPNFAEYGNITPGKLFEEKYFALLEFNGVRIYDYLSYQTNSPSLGIKLKKYLDLYFEWDYVNSSSIFLDLAEFAVIRQGNLKFIPKKKCKGIMQDYNSFPLGNYQITGDAIIKSKYKTYVQNPLCRYINSSQSKIDFEDWYEEGWYEVMLNS